MAQRRAMHGPEEPDEYVEELLGLSEGMTTGGQVWIQFIGVAATFAWCAVLTWIILKVIDAVIGLRVDSDEETQGLDIVLHDETGYNL